MEREIWREMWSAEQNKNVRDFGYKLFMQYYNKLTGIPSLVELTSHFVAANVISSSDGEAITSTVATKSQTAALRKLLTKILTVSHNDHKPFYKMLRIMQAHGHSEARLLATYLLEKFSGFLSSVSTGTGTYIFIYILYIDAYLWYITTCSYVCIRVNKYTFGI